MNIISLTVVASLMGIVAPGVMQMSLAPVLAQKRSSNFGIAESAAVVFAAEYEGTNDIPSDTAQCPDLVDLGNRSWEITCTEGDGRFIQHVTRAFRLMPIASNAYTNPNRVFAFDAPAKFSHVECPPNDPFGVIWYNAHLRAGHMDACIPSAAWSKPRYLASSPDDWLFDLSNFGFGKHPGY
jgi:hypothetical protein